MARIGKIARLPIAIRDALNQRLIAGEPAAKILPWLNALPEVTTLLTEEFNGAPINDENLSKWRMGGLQDWQGRRERIDHIRELSKFAVHLAQANGSTIAEGGAAIASGRLLELLEATDGKLNPEELADTINGLTSLRAAEVADKRVAIEHAKLKQKDEELTLARQKFHRQTCELFIKWFASEQARTIAESPIAFTDKVEKLGREMWGDLWDLQDANPKNTQPATRNTP